MKKIILVAGILFTLGSVSVAGCLLMASRITTNAHREFFDLVASADPNQLLEQSDDQLVRDIDAPVLQAWMNELNQALGNYKRTLVDGFKCNTHQSENSRITEISGIAVFDRGQATASLTYIDGKLAGFRVDSDQLPSGWFTGPTDTTLYQERSEKFLQAMLQDRPLDAFTMMHEALQKEVTVDSLRLMGQRVIQVAGPIKKMNSTEQQFNDEEGQRLTVKTKVVGQNETMDARVIFQFIGMKGHLLEFGLTPRPTPQKVTKG